MYVKILRNKYDIKLHTQYAPNGVKICNAISKFLLIA